MSPITAYLLGNMFGVLLATFLIMIICDILAIIFANNIFGWIIYGIGAGITLILILGMESPIDIDSDVKWFCFGLLLALGAWGIFKRRQRKHYAYLEELASTASRKVCSLCGNRVEPVDGVCPRCGNKF